MSEHEGVGFVRNAWNYWKSNFNGDITIDGARRRELGTMFRDEQRRQVELVGDSKAPEALEVNPRQQGGDRRRLLATRHLRMDHPAFDRQASEVATAAAAASRMAGATTLPMLQVTPPLPRDNAERELRVHTYTMPRTKKYIGWKFIRYDPDARPEPLGTLGLGFYRNVWRPTAAMCVFGGLLGALQWRTARVGAMRVHIAAVSRQFSQQTFVLLGTYSLVEWVLTMGSPVHDLKSSLVAGCFAGMLNSLEPLQRGTPMAFSVLFWAGVMGILMGAALFGTHSMLERAESAEFDPTERHMDVFDPPGIYLLLDKCRALYGGDVPMGGRTPISSDGQVGDAHPHEHMKPIREFRPFW
eukprot:NODE_1677_length_1253_cov_41.085258_g1662_i0.p1 GENE.NODE_1677_length_1253_cov_41.085258_g1662_i0~~NODE_1677_length_1253_cov_41.085258_g1662_i0.p1  ORF type:complete len:356 (+),score=12.16 NODE_1677_length_1253_cov_41.085258_g1662_i0:53-1120(+)